MVGRRRRNPHRRPRPSRRRQRLASDLNPSSHRESGRFCTAIVHLVRFCVRQVIENQQAYFSQFFGGRRQDLIISLSNESRLQKIRMLYDLNPNFHALCELAVSSNENIRLFFDR